MSELDLDELIVRFRDDQHIIGVINKILPQLPREVRKELNWLKIRMFQEFGEDGLRERFNNRSVGFLLKEFLDQFPMVY